MRTTFITLISLLFISSVFSQELILERDSHPHSPDDSLNVESIYKERSLILASGVNALIQQQEWLHTQLNRFPSPESKSSPPQSKFGFLCPMDTADSEAWIELKLSQNNDVKFEGLALVPALYHKHATDTNYGFPKRFKIVVYTLADPSTPTTIVDWTAQDFPDPGLSPVIFNIPEMRVNRVRLIVTKGATNSDTNFFALDELMVFRNDINIAPPIASHLTSSASSNLAPYWHLQYLVDDHSHVGKSLTATDNVQDFIQYHSSATTSEKPVITVDLGKEYSIGRIELYAAQEPNSPIPSIPLPKQYQLELLDQIDPANATWSELISRSDRQKVRFHPLHSISGRYLRLTFTKLPLHNGKPVLALGEFRIIGDEGENQSMLELDKKVSLSASSELATASPLLLIDGYTNGRQIISEKLFIEQLAKRAIVEKSYHEVTQALAIARAVRTQRYWGVGIILAGLLIAGLLLWASRQKSQKDKAVFTLQKQIAADLHDDISGNLGTISMISNRLHRLSDDTLAQEKLREIDHLSQESYISVKEIIWHTDSQIVRLSDLLKQIQRTAHSILSGCSLQYDFQSEYNDIEVPVNMRRNIILLVKEALYNCAKYAQASNMLIKSKVTPKELTLIMKDDGCGFDTSCETEANSDSGRGLNNMKQRAKLLGANLTIQSSLGQGTEIKLIMPINTN